MTGPPLPLARAHLVARLTALALAQQVEEIDRALLSGLGRGVRAAQAISNDVHPLERHPHRDPPSAEASLEAYPKCRRQSRQHFGG